jgi:hypothetical protein
MKKLSLYFISSIVALTSCNKMIDVYPSSNLYDQAFYQNTSDVEKALTGCYNGMQKPLYNEWEVTELRSDNTLMGSPTSGSSDNREFSDLDMFMPATSHSGMYDYWLNTYYNIYNVNKVMSNLQVNYHKEDGSITYDSISIPVTLQDRKRLSSQASFIRAYHYFNLVRLFGGVFLIDKPISPADAKYINRSSVDEIYKLIIADLQNTIDNGATANFNAINPNDFGRANAWTAKAMMAKVYLTLNRKTDAIALLQDVISNSGYGLQATYSNVFSTNNEMNNEIMFAVRYKSGKVGLGSPFANLFAPSGSGQAIVNGDGKGYNYPAKELFRKTQGGYDTLVDRRDEFNMNIYFGKIYVKKYISNLIYENDGENDWPVIRYADVLLMLAEAQGFTPASVALVNQIKVRAGLLPVTTIATEAGFEKALSDERRWEFAFENQRWFDLVRFKTTMNSIDPIAVLKTHFSNMYSTHYAQYPQPLSLIELQNLITPEKLLLPIPQREIDINTTIVIAQNPGY